MVNKINKQFKGWAIICSINGSNWGLEHNRKEWPIVSKIVKTKKELDNPVYLIKYINLIKSCCPKQIRKIYK